MNDTVMPAVINQTANLPATAAEIRTNVNLIQQVMQEVMKDGTHYGKIPGCGNNPTLLKAGAEKIMATFRLAADPIVEDLSTSDEARFRVKVRLVSPSGMFVGAGIGECSSDEEKYKWKRTYIKQEFDEMPEDRRRQKWQKYQGNINQVMQIRTSIADVRNTVLKMAKKRGLTDAVLTATAASDIFTQDIEDIPEDLRENLAGQRSEAPHVPDEAKVGQRPEATTNNNATAASGAITMIQKQLERKGISAEEACKEFNVADLTKLTMSKVNDVLAWIQQHA